MNKVRHLENIAIALGALRSHKLRSFLTILGVIMGVMTVIVTASILTGMRGNIVSLIEEYGVDNIYAFHIDTDPRVGSRERREWARKPLTIKDAEAIKIQSTAIEDVAYQGFATPMELLYGGETYRQAGIRGVSPNHAEVANVVLKEGRFITQVDSRRRNPVCLLGVNVVEALFPHQQQIVGRAIELGNRRFTIIGVLEKRKSTFFGESEEDNLVFIPYRTLRKISPRSKFLLIAIRAKGGQLQKAWEEAEGILRHRRGVHYNQPNDFDLKTADRLVEQFDSITAAIGLVTIAISAIGLLVGGIGVMSIMLISVTERTREIGIRKAVGARRRDITFQFLVEAMTLTTVGGVTGIVFAIAVNSIVIWLIPEFPARVPLWAIVSGFAVSVSVGFIFGAWPAAKASRLDPIESLRYE